MTLIDLVITVLIIGILAAAALPRYAAAQAAFRADAAAKRIAADLKLARTRAISLSASQTVRFTLSTSSYSIDNMTHIDRHGVSYSVALTDPPYSATLKTISLGSNSLVVFNIYGQPDRSGSIVVSAGGVEKTISLDSANGRITIQ